MHYDNKPLSNLTAPDLASIEAVSTFHKSSVFVELLLHGGDVRPITSAILRAAAFLRRLLASASAARRFRFSPAHSHAPVIKQF
jgi:hypothetical protein